MRFPSLSLKSNSILGKVFPFVFFLLTFYMLFSCSTDPEPPGIEPTPGYQQEIPWPSLADSPWPMAHGDPQNRSIAKFYGPALGQIAWEYTLNQNYARGAVIADEKNNIFFISDSLISLSNNGKLRYKKYIGQTFKCNNSPIILKDHSMIFTNGRDAVVKYDSSGMEIWRFELFSQSLNESIGIDKNGFIYFTTIDQKLISLSKDGELRWEIFDNRFPSNFDSFSLAFSPDGHLVYFPAKENSVICVDINTKEILWGYGDFGGNPKSILIDSFGNIYLEEIVEYASLQVRFVSLDSKGALRWKSDFTYESSLDNKPCIDVYGNLYFGADTIYSYDYSGKLRFKSNLNGRCNSPLLTDNSGRIFVLSNRAGIEYPTLTSLNYTGIVNWQIELHNYGTISGSPFISEFNEMVIPLDEVKIIKIK